MGGVSWFVARRYLTARRRQAFVSLISAVSILGVGVGVMALIVALGLMTGVQHELRDRIVGASAHLFVYPRAGTFGDLADERAKVARPDVIGVAPAVFGMALVRTGTHDEFVQLKGIDPRTEPDVTDLTRSIVTGSLAALADRPETARDGVILGADLAQKLGVTVGDTVDIVTPEPVSTPFAAVPRMRIVEVVGTFRFNFYEFDQTYAFLRIDQAERLLNKDGPDTLQIRLRDIDDALRVRDELQRTLGAAYLVEDYTQQNASLYSALFLEKIAISLTIGLIVMVAALNIVATLILLVMEKSRDIAILRTMGAPARMIRRIFVYQGLTIGLVGTAAGAVLGIALCLLADRYRLVKLNADVYQIPYLPFRLQPFDVTVVIVSAIVVCLVATLYPSRQAGRIDPAEALRNQ